MVWRRMLFDKYQGCCLVLGHPNILFILSLHNCLVSAQEDICMAIFEWNDLSNSGSPFCLSLRSRVYMVWKEILFDVLKTAAMAIQHNDSAGCESTIPSLMPYKLCAAL